MSSFESELCALVAVWRAKGADQASMLEALDAERAALEHHVAAERADTPQAPVAPDSEAKS